MPRKKKSEQTEDKIEKPKTPKKKKAPSIRTDSRWQDSNFVDKKKLSKRQLEELDDPDNPMAYANVYDSDDYEAITEEYNPYQGEYSDKDFVDIWGEFVPTKYQYEWYEFFNEREEDGTFKKHKQGVAVVHRRFGKSVGVLKTVFVPRLLEDRGLYMHSFPSLTQARGAIWNGMGKITRDLKKPSIRYLELIPREYWHKRNNHDMTLELTNGSIYRLCGIKGTDGTANHLRGLNPLGNVGDENGEWDGNVITEIFDPIFAQNGGFNFDIGTPKGENHFFENYMFLNNNLSPTQKAWLLTIEDTYYNDGTPIISKEYVEGLLKKGTEPETIQQEYYCSFKASASGAWYKHALQRVEDEGRIREVPYNESFPVYAGWDIGGDGQRAIIFQAYDDYIRIIDCIYMKDVPIGVIMDSVLAKYRIKQHFFPADGKQKMDAIDRWESRIEGLKKKGITNISVVKRSTSVADGVQVAREMMTRCLFDSVKAQKIINDIRNYKRKQNKQTKEFIDDHVHDKHSHGADAFRTISSAYNQGLFQIQNQFNRFLTPKKIISKFATFNFNVNM